MSIDSAALRSVLSAYATGVAVAMAVLPDGQRVGMTINSFTSVSLDPPLVLFCLDKHAVACPVFEKADVFSINVLASEQEDVSRAYARRGQGDERWQAGAVVTGESGALILETALATLECVRHAIYDGGDHHIIVGRVVGMGRREGAPLLYWNSAYRRLP